ncbi:MAG: hypothetical protein AAF533_06110 [Acidobacteriota bacterium]
MTPRHVISVAPLVLIATLLSSPLAQACEDPPTDTTVPNLVGNLLVNPTRIVPGETVEITLAVTNFGPAGAVPPAYQDDQPIDVHLELLLRHDPTDQDLPCIFLNPEPLRYGERDWHVELDDAYSPHADEPVSWTETVTFRIPETDAERLEVRMGAFGVLPHQHVFFARCLEIEHEPTSSPHATFTTPLGMGPSGGSVPLEIHVDRNGYDPTRPLQLVVERENISNPLDLFPITPEPLLEGGVTILEEQSTIELSCGLHFPCYVGMANNLHVKLLDEDTVVWESRLSRPDGLAEACVSASPLVQYELVSVDGGPPAPLPSGVDTEVVVRAYARNPSVGATMHDLRLDLDLPAGVTLQEHWLHHHDNPLDRARPTRDELTAAAQLTENDGHLHVTASRLEHRFVDVAAGPPIFWDLLEADLTLRISGGLLRPGKRLVLPGFTLQAELGGRAREARSDDLVLGVAGGLTFEPPVGVRPGQPGRPRTPTPSPGLPRRSSERR